MLFKLFHALALVCLIGSVLGAPLSSPPADFEPKDLSRFDAVRNTCIQYGWQSTQCEELLRSAPHYSGVHRRSFFGDLWNTITAPVKAIMTPIRSIIGMTEKIPIIGGLVKTVVDLDSAMPWMIPFNAITGGLQPKEANAGKAPEGQNTTQSGPYDGSYMCELKGGGSGAFSQSNLDTFKSNWKDGITELDLVSSRVQICGTANLSDAEVAFFNDQLTSPKIITPHEGAFTATEEARYQQSLTQATADQKKTVLDSLSKIPNISQREIQMLTDAANGKPVSIQPDDGMPSTTTTNAGDNSI